MMNGKSKGKSRILRKVAESQGLPVVELPVITPAHSNSEFELLQMVRSIAGDIRNTAYQLKIGMIHPHHAANRLLKLANRLDGGK